MAAQSFSHLMSNLFVGLCKGTASLRPYSTEFSRDLGYRVFGLESEFLAMSASSEVKPDMVVSSPKTSNTLVLEWTEHPDPSKKDTQLGKYAKIERRDLTEVLGVPVKEASSHDVVIVVPYECASGYEELIHARGWRFPLLSHKSEKGGDSLSHNCSPLSAEPTNKFFQSGIRIDPARIPLHYIPFPLDSVTPKSVAASVATHVISLATKGGGEVSLTDFCEGYFPVWDQLDRSARSDSIRSNIKAATRGVLNRLCRMKSMKSLITRSNQTPPKWNITNIRGSGSNKTLQSRMQSFVDSIRGALHQPDLFDHPPEE